MENYFEAQLKSLGDTVQGHIEEWRTEDGERRQELEQTIKSLENEIGQVKEQLAEERRAHLPGVEIAKGNERDAFSLSRACRALARKDFNDAPYEAEVFAEMKSKAMSQGTDTAGGYIVPEEAITQVIEKLKAQVVAYDLGARDMATTGVPVTIPKLSTAATGYWVSENSTITASDLGFEQINMTPKTVAGRVILSNLLLETSQPAADQIIEQDLAQQLGLAVDLGVLNGSSGGGAGEPVGIIQTSGVGTFSTSMTASVAPTLSELMDAMDDLSTANALRGKLGWAMHPLALSKCRQILENGGGTYIPVAPVNTTSSFTDSLFGYPVRTSTQLPTVAANSASIIFGNFDDVIIARWGGMRLLASDTSDDAFSKDQTHIRATMRVDVAVRHPESFTVSA
jgi:HK97 family phage major capsid protein